MECQLLSNCFKINMQVLRPFGATCFEPFVPFGTRSLNAWKPSQYYFKITLLVGVLRFRQISGTVVKILACSTRSISLVRILVQEILCMLLKVMGNLFSVINLNLLILIRLMRSGQDSHKIEGLCKVNELE